MLTYTDFLKAYLSEELTERQKKKVDDMPSMNYSIKKQHNQVFGDSDRIILPYHGSESDEKITTHNIHHGRGMYDSHASQVLTALRSRGYHTDDYESGLAYHESNPDRKMKIGKILEKEKADSWPSITKNKKGELLSIKQLYDADPLKASSKNGEKQIVISKNRYDVAGMSTDRGWKSCMNLEDGCNKHYLKHDMEHGTLTAYVTKKGDDEAKNPIGRINIKRFENSSGHNIFRPENSIYGSVPKGVKKAVRDWSEKHYPSNPGIYIKHSSLYNDDGDQIKFEKPEQMVHSDHAKSLKSIHHAISDYHDAAFQNNDKFPDYDNDPNNEVQHFTHKLISKFPDSAKLHFAVHQIADRTDDDNTSEPYEHGYDASPHHYTHEWAKNYIDNSPFNNAIHDTDHETLMKYHQILHNSGVDARSPEDHPEHQALHGQIIDHILKHGNDQMKEHVLSDITNDKIGHEDYYRPMFNENSDTMFNNNIHPLDLTKNPRTMHHMLHTEHEERFPSEPDEQTWNHIGKHADAKLTKDLFNGHFSHMMEDDDHRHAFYQGMKHNPEGENIQHELLQNINFKGGKSGYQEKLHSGYRMNGHHVSPYSSYKIQFEPGDKIDPASDDKMHSHFKSIAETTPFHSVHDVLKNRTDFKNDEEIQNHLSDNPHF